MNLKDNAKMRLTLALVWACVATGVRGQSQCAAHLPPTAAPTGRPFQIFNHIDLAPGKPGVNCITYDDVDAAVRSAVSVIGLSAPGAEVTPESIAPVGRVLLETSRIIATQYGLNPQQIAQILPRIDATRTAILGFCPAIALPMTCTPGKYRRIDGLCNNLQHPSWGATRTVFQRFLPPAYPDGLGQPRGTTANHPLPNPRVVSSMVHKDEGFHDHAATTMLVAWGQLMDHDFTLTAMELDAVSRNEPEICCDRPSSSRHRDCLPITVSHQDPFYSLFNFHCIDFVRGFPGVPENCRLGPRNQINILTGVIDGNTVYGGTDQAARELRAGVGGLLREHKAFSDNRLKALLPLKTDIPDEGCIRANDNERCFLAGEIRVNEQLILACMHTLLMREHNRVARELQQLNQHWDDETLYQESRRIVAAIIQHVTYNEFLPQLLGRGVMEEHDLVLTEEGYWDGYDPTADPSIAASFAAAAFRFGHSLLPSAIERWSPSHAFIASKRLNRLIRQPFDLMRPGWLDEYYLGMANQPAQAMDDSITQEVTNHLFTMPGRDHGFDLVSFNLQRGREVGLPGYGEWRKLCGLPRISNFEELAGIMTNNTAQIYSRLYRSVDDIDLWSAGVSERPLPGSLLGPTFSCIIARQMSVARRGDRYWYELPGQPSSFTEGQLAALRKVTLSRLLCDNTDTIETIQKFPLVLQDPRINPRVSCRSGELTRLDLTPWRDPQTPRKIFQSQSSTPGQGLFFTFGVKK